MEDFMGDLTGVIAVTIPIFICVVLPVAIVFIIFWSVNNRQKMRTKVLLKAIENNSVIDADKLADALTDSKANKTPYEVLNKRMLSGSICTLMGVVFTVFGIVYNSEGIILGGGSLLAVGIGFLIVYFATRKEVKRQMEAEEAKNRAAEIEVVEKISEND